MRREGRGPGGRPAFGGSSSQEVQEISVKAYRVERQPISTYILSNTTLEPIRSVTVLSQVSSDVIEILVEEGDSVRQGQVVARLDQREIRNDYEQSKIAVDQAEIQVRQAEVRADQSKANHARSITLRGQKLISQQDFDQTELSERTDLLAYDVAKQQYEAAKARLEASQLQLEYTEIRASIDGVITERLIEVGDRLNVNQEVFRVEDFTPLWARIFIPEKDLPKISVGQTARLEIEAFPERRFRGRIKMINPRVDSESGTVKVTVEVADTRGGLRPGMFGLVYIPTATRGDALIVPKKSILRERDETRVFVIAEDGTVEKRTVETGISEEGRVEIVSGLSQGESIVTVGQESLNDGYPVRVLAWEGNAGNPQERMASTQPSESPARNAADSTPSSEAAADGSTNGDRRGPAARPNQGQRGSFGGQRGGRGRGMGGGSPEERRARLMQMIESNPAWKKEWDKRLAEDPQMAEKPEKIRAFFREVMRGRGSRQ